MTYEEAKIKEKTADYVANNNAADSLVKLRNRIFFELHNEIKEILAREISDAYEQGYKDAIKEKEERK